MVNWAKEWTTADYWDPFLTADFTLLTKYARISRHGLPY